MAERQQDLRWTDGCGMYLDHFKLSDKPFRVNTDPRFLWRGDKYTAALNMLHEGVREDLGLVLLTGDVGMGKTTLVSTLLSQLDDNEVVAAKVPNPGTDPDDLYLLIAHGFGLRRHAKSRDEFIEVLTGFLDGAFAAGKKALLIIDEAQSMSSNTLEEIHALSGMGFNGDHRLNIFLVGQTELDQLLLSPPNWAIRDQISLKYKLPYLSEPETADYIAHRLRVAGANGHFFSEDAIAEIYELSNGSPRQINNLCESALLYGFEKGVAVIDRSLVEESKNTVLIPGDQRRTATARRRAPDRTADDPAVPVDLFEVEEKADRQTATTPGEAPKRFSRGLALTGVALLMLLSVGYFLYPAKITDRATPETARTGPPVTVPEAQTTTAAPSSASLQLPGNSSLQPPPGVAPLERTSEAEISLPISKPVKALLKKETTLSEPAPTDRSDPTPNKPVVAAVTGPAAPSGQPEDTAAATTASLQPTPKAIVPARKAAAVPEAAPEPVEAAPPTENPAPADIIDWLLQERAKGQ